MDGEKSFGTTFLIAALAFGAAYYMWWDNSQNACKDSLTWCVKVGKMGDLTYSSAVRSVSGLSKTHSASATLALDDGTTYDLEPTWYGNDEWGDSIEQFGFGIKGVSVTSITSPVKLKLKFPFDELDIEPGQNGVLHIAANVTFPKMEDEDLDNVVARSVLGSKAATIASGGGVTLSYIDTTQTIEEDVKIQFKSAGFSGQGYSDFWFWTAIVIGSLSTLAFIGNFLEDD